MIKWAEGEQGAREARELKDATNFRLGLRRRYPDHPAFYTDLHTEYQLAYHAEKANLLRKTKALHWFAEFSEGVMGWVHKPSPSVVDALIDAIEKWLKESTRTA